MLGEKPKYRPGFAKCDKFILHAIGIDWYYCRNDRNVRWKKNNNDTVHDVGYPTKEQETIRNFVYSIGKEKY